MNTDCIITLISSKNTNGATNAIGVPIFYETKTDVFGIKKAVKQSEFFQASSKGFKPEVVVEVNSFEFNNENECELEGQRFRIYRTYPIAKSEKTELYLTQLIGETDVTT
ncbi:MAG: hypothetical protein ACI4HO_09115 [Ruminococcus sp.]